MASSYAPSVVSSRSSASRRARIDKEAQEAEGHGDLLQRSRSLENGIFGVLFTLSKEKSDTRVRIRWVLLKVALDAWQLFTTVINPATQGWRIDANGTAWAVVGVLNFTWLSDLGYGAYLAVLYAMVVLLAANLAMCVWVAWCFKEQKFPVVWPVKVLRVFSSIFFQAFDVTSLNLLQLGISCRYTGPDEPHMRFKLFPQYSCSSTPHVAHAVVSALSLGQFVAVALLLNMAEIEVNPKSRRPLALGHSGPEVMAFATKVLLTLVDVFIGWRTVAACCYLALSLALAWQYIRWNPHLVPWMNYLKSGSSVSIVWCSAMLMLLVFRPGVAAGQEGRWASALTTAMLAGLAPAFGLGALASWAMIRHLTRTSLHALANAKPDMPLEDVCANIDDAKDVEVVARCCRVWREGNALEPEAINRAHGVIKAGLAMFPNSAYMVLLHANFMIDVLGVSQSGNARLEDARKLNPGLMSRFIVFVRRQQATQRAAGQSASDGTNMDLLGYVEYQRKQRMVIRLHREALQAMCNFWKALDASNISFTHLSKALGKIESSVSQAQTAYRVVLESYGNNPKLVRLYGKFLQTIKNDPWGASEYFAEAERLEELKNGDSSGPLLPDGTPLGRMDEMSIGVLVLSVTGEIQVANRQTHQLFGIKRGMLEGKPITSLLAPHCSRWVLSHLTELMNESGLAVVAVAPQQQSGGGGGVSGSRHEAVLVGMHTDRLAFPVKVSISRVSGVGEDSTFIALLEPLEPEKDVASLWIAHNGSIAACDPHFVSFFGWRAYEVNGASITAFAAIDASEGQQAASGDLEAGRVAARQSASDGIARLLAKARVDSGDPDGKLGHGLRCLVAHKYDSTPVPCVLSITQADTADMPVFEARIRLATSTPPQLMVVGRKGNLVHVSSDLVASLKDVSGGLRSRQPGFGAPGPHQSPGYDGAANGQSEGVVLGTDQLTGYTLSDFLPPPWRDMHVKYLKDTTALTAPGRGPWSCRRGGSPGPTLELRTASGKPLFMHVRVDTSEAAGEVNHVVRMERSSLETALAERRLRLSLSEEGLIAAVDSGSPTQLFGLDASKIVGRGLWEVIEDLSGAQDGVEATSGPQLLKALIARSLDFPGHSWRVRVSPPPRANAGLASELTAAARASTAKVAVIQVHLEVPSEDAPQDVPPSLYIDLWPLPSVSGVLELDGSGRITCLLEESLRPAGLLFGLPGGSLLGSCLEELLELPPGRTGPADLLSLHGTKKSSLKVKKKDVHVKVGPVHVLQGVHADGLPLALEVQVVGRPGPNQPLTAILRPHKTPMQPAAAPLAGAAGPRPASAVPAASAATAAAWLSKAEPVPSIALPPPASPLLSPKVTEPAVRQSSKLTDNERPLSASRLSHKRSLLPPSPLLDTGATPLLALSPRPTGYSNARTNSDEVEVLAPAALPAPPPPDLLATGATDGVPVPGVTTGKAAAIAGRSKLASLVKAAGSGGSAGSPTADSLPASRLGTGTGLLTPSKPDVRLLLMKHLEEPELPGSPTQPGRPAGAIPKKFPSRVTLAAADASDEDAQSETGTEVLGLKRKASRVSEATERIATWVKSEGTYYQNSVVPGGNGNKRSDDGDASGHSGDLSIGISFMRALSGGRAAPGGLAAAGGSRPGSPAVTAKGAAPEPLRAGGNYADDDAASEGGQSAVSGVSGVSDQAGGGAEYKRGKRFRKLAKLMDSSQAQQVSQRFRSHAIGVVVLLAFVHIACFVVSINSIQAQKRSMMQLGRSDESQRYMHRVMTDVRSLDVISRNKTVPHLFTAEDTEFFIKRIASDAEEIKARLNEMLSAHHNGKSSVMDVLYYTQWKVWNGVADDGSDSYTNMTVWDFGTSFYNYAKDVVQFYEHWLSEGTHITETKPGQFLLKSGPDLWKASRKALDALLFVAVDDTRWVDTLQLIFLAIEGAFLSCLAAGYVSYLLRALSAQRYKLYSTFLVIPVGLTRALASQNTALLVDEDEDDIDNDDDRVAADEPGEEQDEEGTAAKAKRRATLNVTEPEGAVEGSGPSRGLRRLASRNGNPLGPLGGKGAQSLKVALDDKDEAPRGRFSFLRSLASRLKRGFRRGKSVSPLPVALGGAISKRNLRYDSHETAMMVTPFVLWSAMVIAIYATAVIKMQDVVEVVAIHAVANFMAARTYRTIFFTQELAVLEDPALLPSRRAALLACRKVVTDAYYTLQLGEKAYKATGFETERFPMVKSGLAFASPQLADVFYASGRCHRRPEHLPCPGPDYRFYQTVYTGIDSIMREFLSRVSDLALSNSTIPPGLGDDNVDYIYSVGTVDLSDGTVEIEQYHYDSIAALFTRILLLHIILFLLLWVVIAGFLFILLNPVLKRVSRERKHIAELMSQLPLELDVEKLVARALGTLAGPAAGQGNGNTQDSPMVGNTDGHESDSGTEATNKWKAIIRSTSNAVAKQASGNLSVKRMSSSGVAGAGH